MTYLHPALTIGVPIRLSKVARDGEILWVGGRGVMLLIGTRPLTVLEQAGRDARRLVREGMADVLEWLSEPVNIEPTSAEILTALRALAAERGIVLGRPETYPT